MKDTLLETVNYLAGHMSIRGECWQLDATSRTDITAINGALMLLKTAAHAIDPSY